MKGFKKFKYFVVPIALILCVILFTALWMNSTTNVLTSKTATEISDLYLRELSIASRKHLQTSLDYHYSYVDSIAHMLTPNIANDDALFREFIVQTKQTHDLAALAFLDKDGYCHDETGSYSAAGKVSFLGSLLRGQTHLISYNENVQNSDVIMIGSRIQPIKAQNSEYIAILACIDIQTMSGKIMLSNDHSKTYSGVVTSDGTYVILSDVNAKFRGSNLLSALKKSFNFSEERGFEKFTDGLKMNGTGMFYITSDTGDAYYMYYSPMENTDWFLVSFMPYEVIEGTIHTLGDNINKNSIAVFCVFLAILLGIFIMYIYASRKRQEQLEQAKSAAEHAFKVAEDANKAKSVFLSNMSHDIRTPMNAIVGFANLLTIDADNGDRVREYAKKITLSSKHLLGLINDVLDMAKIESGKTVLNISSTNLAEFIEDINTIIRPQIRMKNHKFDIYIHNITHENVNADRLRMHQILLNLLSNAIKYTPEGGHIILEIEELSQDTPHYASFRFKVTDNGYGMDKKYLQYIFDVFSREQNSVVNKIQGTGLGLSITKSLVNLMNGKISVESEKGKGSVFTVDLELMITEDVDVSEFWRTHHLSRMLVVDDEESVCKNVEWTMENIGVDVDYSLNGTEAVELVRSAEEKDEHYNTILLDWKMPDKDGIEVAKELRAILPPNVSILILTAYDYSEIEHEMLTGVVDGFIPKPFFESNLRQKLSELMYKTEAAQNRDSVESCMKGKRILIAEDNELNAEILTELLNVNGAECVVCTNGREVYDEFLQSPKNEYQLILMDVQMPEMDGYRATRMIRSCTHPQAKTVPIIAMTANAFAEDVQDALDAGMNAHLAKPIDMDLLESVVKDLI